MATTKRKQPRPCEECLSFLAVAGERFCTGCRRELLKKMERDGYLTERPSKTKVIREHADRRQLDVKQFGTEMLSDGDDW